MVRKIHQIANKIGYVPLGQKTYSSADLHTCETLAAHKAEKLKKRIQKFCQNCSP